MKFQNCFPAVVLALLALLDTAFSLEYVYGTSRLIIIFSGNSTVQKLFVAPLCPAYTGTVLIHTATPTRSDAYLTTTIIIDSPKTYVATPKVTPGATSTPQPVPEPANSPSEQVPLGRICSFFCSVEVAETISWLGPALVSRYGYFGLDRDFARAPRAVDLEHEFWNYINSLLGFLVSTIATFTQFFCLRSDLRWSVFAINFISWTRCVLGAGGAYGIFKARLKEFIERFEARTQELDRQGRRWRDGRTEMEKWLVKEFGKHV